MRTFIDESGTFNLTDINQISVMGMLFFPESMEYKLDKFFKKLYKQTTKYEKDDNGEIKGTKLSDENLELVFNFLRKNTDIKITLDVIDNELHTPTDLLKFRKGQALAVQEGLERYMKGPVKAQQMQNDLLRIKKWSESPKKIGNQDYLQIIILINELETALQKMIIYFNKRKYAKSFNKFDFIFDNKTSKKMLRYINDVVPIMLQTKAHGRDLIEIEGTVFKGHPLEKYIIATEDLNGYDLGKIFSKGIQFADSKDHYGLQLIDIVVSGIYGILTRKRKKELFDLIRYNCTYFKNDWRPFSLFVLSTATFPTKESKLSRDDLYQYFQNPPAKCWSKLMGK